MTVAQVEAAPLGFVAAGEPRWEFFKSQLLPGDEIRQIVSTRPGKTGSGYTILRGGKFIGLTLIVSEV
jgi:hypothetical protein